jgi:hypothetical protein
MAEPRPSPLHCDVRGLPPDAVTIDSLARLQLAARRAGHELALRGVSPDLLDLLDLCGLRSVLRVEMGRQTEQREEGVRVEEERELDDLAP